MSTHISTPLSAPVVAIGEQINQTELLKRPHWTKAMIPRLLGAPDKVECWQYYSKTGTRNLYAVARIIEAEASPAFAAVLEKRIKNEADVREVPLIVAIREISRAAHRWRDAAQSQYQNQSHGLAGFAKRRKEYLYQLKECSIVAAHRAGELRYIGESPQRMAVYEYGDGGMSCFHSCLHPVGVERVQIPNHPETLHVAAKKAAARMKDVEYTLSLLSDDTTGYERSGAPRIARAEKTCYNCGMPGHLARDCRDDDDDDDDLEDWED